MNYPRDDLSGSETSGSELSGGEGFRVFLLGDELTYNQWANRT